MLSRSVLTLEARATALQGHVLLLEEEKPLGCRPQEAKTARVCGQSFGASVASGLCSPCMHKGLNTEVARATTDLGLTEGCPRFG